MQHSIPESQDGGFPTGRERPAHPRRARGFVLPLTVFLILGVTAISVGILFNGKMGRMSANNYKHKVGTFLAADGMVTLLAQELINGKGLKYVDTSRTGRIQGKIWYGIGGTSVASFKTLAAADHYSESISSPYLGSNLGKSNYGIKWAGWIIPPLTGAYTFITRSDDESRFYISTDAEERHLSSQPVCRIEPGWVLAWPTSGPAVSAPIPLEGGHRYYFEYYHTQGANWDVGEVGWNGPEYFFERPISGQYLSPYKSDPDWGGTAKVGKTPVRFNVVPMGMDAYRISAQAVQTKPGAPTDTAYRLDLTQALSLRGDPVPPPKKMYLRVIHHDFPSIGHPEFNMPVWTNGVMRDMVRPTLTDFTPVDAAYFGLTSIPKPTHNLDTPNWGCGLNKWFKDWAFDSWDYQYSNASDCRKTRFNAAGDTYRNTKIYDSLEFDLDENEGPMTYVYSHMGNHETGDPLTAWRGESEYFPLDWRGQDPPGSGHDYSFCTELHTTFLHQSGLKFEFTGDDDVWGFINGNLIIDLGGLHGSTNTIVNLDDLTWLTYGKTYPLDFFQCERHTIRSTSRIVTNIKMGRPKGDPVGNWRRDYGPPN